MAEFAIARDWDQFHTIRNLSLALVGEVGELCECFQWKGEVPDGLVGWSEKDRVHLGQVFNGLFNGSFNGSFIGSFNGLCNGLFNGLCNGSFNGLFNGLCNGLFDGLNGA